MTDGFIDIKAFDPKYFTPDRTFVMKTWKVKCPVRGSDSYTPVHVESSRLVRVKGIRDNGTTLMLYVFENHDVRQMEVSASVVWHGYYKFYPVRIIREDGEECS